MTSSCTEICHSVAMFMMSILGLLTFKIPREALWDLVRHFENIFWTRYSIIWTQLSCFILTNTTWWLNCYSDITWNQLRLKSPTTWLFTGNKENDWYIFLHNRTSRHLTYSALVRFVVAYILSASTVCWKNIWPCAQGIRFMARKFGQLFEHVEIWMEHSTSNWLLWNIPVTGPGWCLVKIGSGNG